MMKNIRNESEENLDTDLIAKFNLITSFDKAMRTLSGGTRQKVSAAFAFYFDPQILILDEPTAGLDPLSSEILKEKILAEKRKDKLILITSHVLSDLDDLATDVMYMQEGKMEFFKPIETIRKETGETQTLAWKPDRTGVFPIYCTDFCSALHQEMQGYIRVSAAGSNVPITFSMGKTEPTGPIAETK